MKAIFSFILIAIAMITGSAAQAQSKNEVTVKLGFYCDHFDQCETGKSRLEKELMFTKGVKDIKTDSQSRTITVKFNPKKTSEQNIREAISKAGYDADDMKADPKGYAKLDECCKKKE